MLIADIQRQLAPGAEVTHNAKLQGEDSGALRQIDVLVRQSVGQYNVTIVIDCKDHSDPVDVKGVEEFAGLVKDVRAHQGSMVCPKGFTRSAKKLARHLNIALYSPVDTAKHKWQTAVSLPVLCEFRRASISFKISVSAPVPFKMDYDFLSTLMVFDADGEAQSTCAEYALNRWNTGEYPIDIGIHKDVPIFVVEPYVDNGYGMRVAVELTLELEVTGRRYFGVLPLSEIRGLRDEQTGAVYTNAFTTGILSPVEIENQWERLDDGADPPSPVSLRITGLDCFAIEGKRQR